MKLEGDKITLASPMLHKMCLQTEPLQIVFNRQNKMNYTLEMANN